MKITQVLVEATQASVAFAFGRFNPAHRGHIEVWRAVEEAGKNWFIGTNPTTIGPNDPLTFEQKSAWMEEIYPPITGHIVPQTTVLSLAAYIFKKLRNNESATIAYVTDDTDWAWSGKLLNQYNGVEGAHGYYKFAQITHVPSPRVSSATALRDAARADDKVAFYHASGTDPKLKVAGKTYFDTVKEACEKYPLPVKRAKKVKEAIEFADTGSAFDNGQQDAMNFRPKNDEKYPLRHKYRTRYSDGYKYGISKRDRSINPETGKPYVVFGPASKGEYDPVRSGHLSDYNPAPYIFSYYNMAKKEADRTGKKVVRGGVSKWKIVDKNDPAPEIFEDEQKTVAKTWDQMTPKEKISGVKGRTVWNEKTKKYYTVFDVPAKQETSEASLSTMRDYFAGDEQAHDPYEITKQRLHFSKDKNAKATTQKRFKSQAEYEDWLIQNHLKHITPIKEDEEAGEVKKTGQLIPFPAGTTKVHVSDVYDWYKLGMVISDLDDADPNMFGQGAPESIIAFGSEEEESKLMPLLKRLGLRIDDIDPEGVDVDEAYHAGSLYEMLSKRKQ